MVVVTGWHPLHCMRWVLSEKKRISAFEVDCKLNFIAKTSPKLMLYKLNFAANPPPGAK